MSVCGKTRSVLLCLSLFRAFLLYAKELRGGRPTQVITPKRRMSLTIEDLRGMDTSAQEVRVHAAIRAAVRERFDLTRGPLVRVQLLQLRDEEYVLVRTLHHIVTDERF